MPQLIEHIDAIARQKLRGVLFLRFHPEYKKSPDDDSWLDYDYQRDIRRKNVIRWFKKNNIAWQECAPIASENGYLPYRGEIYIDVPYDENNPHYKIVSNYLENPDGTLRDKNIRFYFLPLEVAMKNAHHDEPGFWDKFAETF